MKKLLVLPILLIIAGTIITTKINAQGVYINENGVAVNTTEATPDASAFLDISADSLGVLLPRMDTSVLNDISNPATGLIAYDTVADVFWYYDGEEWYSLVSSELVKTQETGNLFVGEDAGGSSSGNYNTIGGYQSGNSLTSSYNTFFGYKSGFNNTSGGSNVFLGKTAGYSNTSGTSNVFIGYNSGYYATTYHNTYVGYESGRGSSGSSTGGSNVAIGRRAGYSLTSGHNNYFGGYRSGHNTTSGEDNVCIGSDAGYSNTTGSNNVFLGYQSGYNETGSNKLYIENSSLSTPLIYGDFANDSIIINGSFKSTGNISITDNSTYLSKDVSNNLTFTDAVTGTKTLAELAGGGGDDLGDHTATENIKLNGEWLSNDGGDEGVFVATDGDVGIGTSSPGKKLDVRGDAVFNETGGNYDFKIEGDDYTNLFFLDASADYIGLGTSSPESKLHIDAGYNHSYENSEITVERNQPNGYGGGIKYLCNRPTTSNVSLGSLLWKAYDGSSDQYGAQIRAASVNSWGTSAHDTKIQFKTVNGSGSLTVQMTIMDDGKVGIGDDSPSYELDVDGDIHCTGDLYEDSDESLKKNIQNISGALDKVKLMQGRSYEFDNKGYDMKLSEGTSFGFIAQELIQVAPELVKSYNHVEYETVPIDTSIDPSGFQQTDNKLVDVSLYSINYIGMIPILTEAIKEQQTIIETQNTTIEKLEGDLEELKKTVNELLNE